MITDREFADKLFLPNLEYKDGDRVLAFRCPYCGDDPKKKSKRSAFLFPSKNNEHSLNFKCHRQKKCGVSKNFPNFLKDQDEKLFKSYQMGRYQEGTTGKGFNIPDPDFFENLNKEHLKD